MKILFHFLSTLFGNKDFVTRILKMKLISSPKAENIVGDFLENKQLKNLRNPGVKRTLK